MKITEQQRVTTHNGFARKHGKQATLNLVEWEQTIADFNGMCAYCQKEQFTLLEHFIPVELDGTHAQNCLPACSPCNLKKKNRVGYELIGIFGRERIEQLKQYLTSRGENPLTEVHSIAKKEGLYASMYGNQNATKDENIGTRVPVVLSIADKRKIWATRRLQMQGIEYPTQADIIRYIKDFCYGKIDEDIETQQ